MLMSFTIIIFSVTPQHIPDIKSFVPIFTFLNIYFPGLQTRILHTGFYFSFDILLRTYLHPLASQRLSFIA